jgi:hypothetical protein
MSFALLPVLNICTSGTNRGTALEDDGDELGLEEDGEKIK